MTTDVLGQIFNDALHERINELAKGGMKEQEILQEINDMKIENTLTKLVDAATGNAVKQLKCKMFEMSANHRASGNVFIANQESKWGTCFAASEAMYTIAIEAAEDYSKYVEENIDEHKKESLKHTFLCLQHIHGRACQEFLEILYLMKLGFADGAYARWRSMYELSCIGCFIREQGEHIAKQYLEQSQTEEKSYKWAVGAIDVKGKRPKEWSFAEIQKSCEQKERWKDHYRLACFVTHGSPQGTMKRMANGKNLNIVPIGQSDYGITTPAEHAAISLAWTTSLFLNIFPYADGIVYCKVINAWIDVIRDNYFSTHKRLFNESFDWPQKEV